MLLFISDNCRLDLGQVVVRHKLIVRKPRLAENSLWCDFTLATHHRDV